jgi:hypothetical protein
VNGESFKEALIEILETAELRKGQATTDLRNDNDTPKANSGSTRVQEGKPVQASPSQNEEDGKSGSVGDVVERRKLKFKAVEKVPKTDDNSDTHSKGQDSPKESKGQEKFNEMKSKRKRMTKQQSESDGEAAVTGESSEPLSKKTGSTTPRVNSLSSREVVKKARKGKKTGADGVSL